MHTMPYKDLIFEGTKYNHWFMETMLCYGNHYLFQGGYLKSTGQKIQKKKQKPQKKTIPHITSHITKIKNNF